MDGGDDGAQARSEIVRFISEGSAVATELVMVRDEADTLGRMQQVDDLYESVFQRSADLGNELAGIEATSQTSMVLLTGIEKIDTTFYELQGEYGVEACHWRRYTMVWRCC